MSNPLIVTLSEQRKSLWENMKAVLDGAAGEHRDLTADEVTKYEAMNADLDAMRKRIDLILESEALNVETEAALTRALGSREPEHRMGGRDLAAEFRALAHGRIEAVTFSAVDMRDVWGSGSIQTRALAKGTDSAGGDTVATTFRNTLVEHMVEQSGLMLLGPTVLNTTSGEPIEIPKTLTHGAAEQEKAENTAIGGTDPTFDKVTLGAYKYPQLLLVPSELIDDTAVNLLDYIARAMGRNVGLALAPRLITGTGTGQPNGVVTSATTGVTGGTGVTGAFTADNLIDLMYSVAAPYRNSRSAGWLVKDSTLGAIRKLKDGAGRYLFDTYAGSGAPDTVLGKPIKTDPNVAAVGLSAKSVIFGDFAAYYVRFAGGLRFERSDDFKFDTDQRAYRAIIRADANTVDLTGAIKVFAGAAT